MAQTGSRRGAVIEGGHVYQRSSGFGNTAELPRSKHAIAHCISHTTEIAEPPLQVSRRSWQSWPGLA